MNLKTFIRWQGNKSRYAKHIIKHFPEKYNVYIEPFIGSGAILLKIQPDKWIINDLNKDLITIWKSVRDEPKEIIKIFKQFGQKFIKIPKKDKVEFCRTITSSIDNLGYDVFRASIYMLMKFCVYMGNILVNNKFYFQGLDMHIHTQNKFFFLKDNAFNNLLDVSGFLNKTKGQIFNKDYKHILLKAKEGDFIFLDPPYIENHNYNFNYNENENTLDDGFIIDLYNELKKLDKKNIKWLMTQADTKEIKQIFKEYKISKFEVYRGFTNSYTNELIIKNY